MFPKQFLYALVAVICLLGLVMGAAALEVDSDTTYCFTRDDFSEEETLTGICITGLPDPSTGTVMLGSRVLRSGDILTAGQIDAMTFLPVASQSDQQAVVTYLPIYENRVAPATTMTISIRGKVDQVPVAEDQAIETYKNLSNSAPLKASDPEGKALTYTVTRQPKRGTVTINEDGSFTYTPKKNKVGTDSFTYTVTDPAGNVSREATVTVRILKPKDGTRYADTGSFEAEWLKNNGLFVGEQVGGNLCFHAEKSVSRGEFIAMAVQVLGIPVEEGLTTSVYSDEIPAWLQPYLAAALRSGMTTGLPADDTGIFGPEETVTAAEAAVLLQNAMDLSVSVAAIEAVDGSYPEWAATAVAAMSENNIAIGTGELNREEVAVLLYQVSLLAGNAPGLQMYQ